MTAVVGILNKQAVAIAADSAVTIGLGDEQKILNKANKVFALSKHHPVGIMIYNSANFMRTPWETIIKVYRKNLKDKYFDTLREYQTDFLEFLKAKNYYTDAKTQLMFLSNFSREIIKNVFEAAVNEVEDKNNISEVLEKVESFINRLLTANGNEKCNEFLDYTFEDFKEYSKSLFEEIFSKQLKGVSIRLKEKMELLIYNILITKEEGSIHTGLIFTGFGESEIYPQLIPLNISFLVDNRLRYYVNENRVASIDNDTEAAVCPFAQTDVIETILTGIDPFLDEMYSRNFEQFLKKYNEYILSLIPAQETTLYEQISKLDISKILSQFQLENHKVKQIQNIFPLMSAVETLGKEDLSEMAETLIYLTYLKRRITFAQESVGGPVDVAIISKGDGFIWMKRKQYFKPELNQHFFDNNQRI